MSSSVFFRFKSQKEPSRVAFDGTGISVFELKREIITMNKLGDGTDFELVISSEDNNEVYDDDTSIIPRSTTVIAKRLPPSKPGRGGAARYVSGTMPQNAKNSHRSEVPTTKATSTLTNGLTGMNGAQTEEQRIAAMFKMGADQWAQQQQEMANATPVHRSGPNKGKPANVPDHPPPSGYICYRCGEKGHWIQVCPTNDDPAYENRPRVKRTTGIPRSFLKTVERPLASVNDGTVDDSKQPTGVMVNAEGEWVIAEPDKAAWDQYQAKAKVSAAAQEAAQRGSKELQDKGLECSIDKHLFVDPTQTPCCQTTFCHDCITNALLENDLRCPHCSTENILIDDLKPDEAMNAKIRKYEEERTCAPEKREASLSPIDEQQPKAANPPSAIESKQTSSPPKTQTANSNPRKRPAESEIVNDRTPPGPGSGTTQQGPADTTTSQPKKDTPGSTVNTLSTQSLPYTNNNQMTPQAMNPTAYPNMNNFMQLAMTMAPNMGMNQAFSSPMMMPNGSFMNNDWNNTYAMNFQQQPMNIQGGGFSNGIMPNNAYNQPSNFMNRNGMYGMNGTNGVNGMHSRNMHGQGRGSFANQQRTTFSAASTNDEDSAYFRKPVNPHRHQARRNVPRPTDYREI